MELAIQLTVGTKIHEKYKGGSIRGRPNHSDEGRVRESRGKLCERRSNQNNCIGKDYKNRLNGKIQSDASFRKETERKEEQYSLLK
jgi:hypothetical protein